MTETAPTTPRRWRSGRGVAMNTGPSGEGPQHVTSTPIHQAVEVVRWASSSDDAGTLTTFSIANDVASTRHPAALFVGSSQLAP